MTTDPINLSSWPLPAVPAQRPMSPNNGAVAGSHSTHHASLWHWPCDMICAEGRYFEGGEETGDEKRAAIFIGPESGTVAQPDLVAAARDFRDGVILAVNHEMNQLIRRKYPGFWE